MNWRRWVRRAFHRLGYDIVARDSGQLGVQLDDAQYDLACEAAQKLIHSQGLSAAHYGCGAHRLPKPWLNIDAAVKSDPSPAAYVAADLTDRHPFADAQFEVAFAQDFLEHLTQDESLNFLCEAYRCLREDGILRLSFPGLRGVLRRHYRGSDYAAAATGREEAYARWGHFHFYCEESLELVARHIGFRVMRTVAPGESVHPGLRDLETRADQQDINLYVELVK